MPISEKTQRLKWQLQQAQIPSTIIEHVCSCSTRYGNAYDLYFELYARAMAGLIKRIKEGADQKPWEAALEDIFAELPPDVVTQGRALLIQSRNDKPAQQPGPHSCS